MQVPPLHRFELVLSSGPSRALRLPDFIRHLARIEERLEGGFVRMRHVLRVFSEPVRPWALQAVLPEMHEPDDKNVRRLREVRLETADVSVDLLIIQDVAVDLRERGVAVGDASEQNDELQKVCVRLL